MSFKEQKIVRLFGRTINNVSVIKIQYRDKRTEVLTMVKNQGSKRYGQSARAANA